MRSGKIRQACDCCRTRKIRCNGTNPCVNCIDAALQCTYLVVHKKTGPKGPRRPRPGQSTVSTGRPATTNPVAFSGNCLDGNTRLDNPIPSRFQASDSVDTEFIASCLDAFFKYKYPITPILDRQQMDAALLEVEADPEIYGLMTACCAVIVQSPGLLTISPAKVPMPSWESVSPSSSPSSLPSPSSMPYVGSDASQSRVPVVPGASFLINETLRARQVCNYVEYPSLATIQTSFFLFSAFFCLSNDNSAWFYLREAITFLQLLRLDEENTYSMSLFSEPLLATYSRRMFWTLFVTERAYALQRHRVPTLQKSIALPYEDPEPQKNILPGLFALISLFETFNNDFYALWNQSAAVPSTSAELLVRMQRILMYTLPSISGCTESQMADLLVSREWLKIMVWQLCVSNTLLSSSSSEESMSFRYPVTIAREVILVSQLMPLKAFEANGVGILEKVFDIGCSLADVLSLKPIFTEPSAMEIGPRDYLTELIRIVRTSFGGSDKHEQILMRKAADCWRISISRPLSIAEGGMSDHPQVWEIDNDPAADLN